MDTAKHRYNKIHHPLFFMEQVGSPIVAVGKNGTIIQCSLTNLNWSYLLSSVTKTLKDISEFNFIFGR